MKMKIRSEEDEVTAPEVEVEFWLEVGEDGSILDLRAQQAGRIGPGSSWYVLSIHENGSLKRYGSLPPDLGFQLDSEKRIIDGSYEF